jgi:putative aldouronate transport system permease protein
MILLILKLGTILNVGYESIILLYQPATYEKADVINTFVYRTGIAEGRYDVATAVGLFNGVVSLILVSASNIISKKTTEYGIW